MTHTRLGGAATLALGLAALSGAPSRAGATPPEDVEIVTLASYVPSESFTWSSSGAVADAGTFEFTHEHGGGIPSPAAGTLQLEMLLTGVDGTVTLRLDLVITATATPGVFSFDGPWTATGGTGAYARIRGSGDAHVTGRVDRQSTLQNPEVGTLTGRVHFD